MLGNNKKGNQMSTTKKPRKPKKPTVPLYVIRREEKRPNSDKTFEKELLATTFKDVAVRYFSSLIKAGVKNVSMTTYE